MIRLIRLGLIFSCCLPSFANRLDEYLQATTISLEKDRIAVTMRLSPGVAVAPVVVAAVDGNGDDAFSDAEENAYVEQILEDVLLTLDGDSLSLYLKSKTFPSIRDMRKGLGEIQLEFFAAAPRQSVSQRELVFENHHRSQIGAYLVNALVPPDPDILITAQRRNFEQSSYRLDYSQTRTSMASPSLASLFDQRTWLVALALLMTTRVAFLWRRRA